MSDEIKSDVDDQDVMDAGSLPPNGKPTPRGSSPVKLAKKKKRKRPQDDDDDLAVDDLLKLDESRSPTSPVTELPSKAFLKPSGVSVPAPGPVKNKMAAPTDEPPQKRKSLKKQAEKPAVSVTETKAASASSTRSRA